MWNTSPLPHRPHFPNPIPPLEVITEHWAEFPVHYSRFQLARDFTHGNVYMPILLSQPIPCPTPTPYPHACSLCLHLYSCSGNRFICTIFLDPTYIDICGMHVYSTYVHLYMMFFSFWLPSLCVTDSRSIPVGLHWVITEQLCKFKVYSITTWLKYTVE